MGYLPYFHQETRTGTQDLYRFPNGYGAAVVRHCFPFGNKEGLFELAIFKLDDEGKWDRCLTTPIADDLICGLSPEGVQEILAKIEAL